MKGKIFSIFLLLSFMTFLGTAFVTLQFQRYAVRKKVKREMIAGMNKADLVLLQFTRREKENLEWKHSKEFGYNGNMYDIVETIEKGDSIFYWCWEDNEEAALNKKLDQLTSIALGSNPENQDKQKRLQAFYKSLFYPNIQKKSEKPPSGIGIKESKFIAGIYQSLAHPPTVPPPEELLS